MPNKKNYSIINIQNCIALDGLRPEGNKIKNAILQF